MHRVRSSPRKGGRQSKTTSSTSPQNEVEGDTYKMPVKKRKSRGKKKTEDENRSISEAVTNDLSDSCSTSASLLENTIEDSFSPLSSNKSLTNQSDEVRKRFDDSATEKLFNNTSSLPDTPSTDDLYQPVGQKLLEQLDRGKIRKKGNSIGFGRGAKKVPTPLKICSNCGTQAPVSRAKKCHTCGQFFSSVVAQRFRMQPCPKCNCTPKTSKLTHCENCQFPFDVERTDRSVDHGTPCFEKNSSLTSETTMTTPLNTMMNLGESKETEEVPSSMPAVGYGSLNSKEHSSSVSFQRSLSSPATSQPTDNEEMTPVHSATDDLNIPTKQGTSTELELKKLLKRKLLGSDEAISSKRAHFDEENGTSEDSTASVTQQQHLQLSYSLPPQPPSDNVSSPLLEYAQKISARIMIPPEISPQSGRKTVPKQTKRGKNVPKGAKGKSKKSEVVPNKDLPTTSTLSHSERPITPPSLTNSPLKSFDKRPDTPPSLSSEVSLTPLQPHHKLISYEASSSRHSAPPFYASTAASNTLGYPIDTRASSATPEPPPLALVPPLVPTTTKPHDPTINSIRSIDRSRGTLFCGGYVSSYAPPIYAQSSIPPPPPLITPMTSSPLVMSHQSLLGNNMFLPHRPHPPHHLPSFANPPSSIPPLIPVTHLTENNQQSHDYPPQSVTHRPVIVDPVKLRNEKTEEGNKSTCSKSKTMASIDELYHVVKDGEFTKGEDEDQPTIIPDHEETTMATEEEKTMFNTDEEKKTMSNTEEEEEKTMSNTEEEEKTMFNTEEDTEEDIPPLVSTEDEPVLTNTEEEDERAVINSEKTGKEETSGLSEGKIPSKHSKRKQKLELVSLSKSLATEEGAIEGGDSHAVLKKKKKKKKKEREKEREKGRHNKHDKHSDNSKIKKKKKSKRKEKDLESTSQTEDEDLLQENKKDKKICHDNDNEGERHHQKNILYSIKMKDLTVHQLEWGEYRMTLLLPIPSHTQTMPTETTAPITPISSTQGSVERDVTTPAPGETRILRSSRKRIYEDSADIEEHNEDVKEMKPKKRKKTKGKIKLSDVVNELEKEDQVVTDDFDSSQKSQDNNTSIEEGEDDPGNLPPSFSIYELRNKLFSGYPPRTVHAFTYKFKVKTHRPPLHWIHVLKRVGGLPDTCHMCRLLDAESVKYLCQSHEIEVPPILDQLVDNTFSTKGRKVVDLSQEDPLSFVSNPDILHHKVPQCYFVESQSKKKTTRKQTYHKFLSHQERTQKDSSTHISEDERTDQQEEIKIDTEKKSSRTKKKPPPLLSMRSRSVSPDNSAHKQLSGGGRKKPCPNCGIMVLCKAKKCRNCGKLFGVFTFGRRVCIVCGHINLARMASCFKCNQPLDKAPTALPKDVTDPKDQIEGTELRSAKFDFKFGVKKRRRVHVAVSSTTSPPRHTVNLHGTTAEGDSPEYTFNETPEEFQHEKKKKGDKERHLGYHYGKIPWNDADLALLITSNGTPKFCLQELCVKVIRFHSKSDVFEMVKNLDLPLEQGDTCLLKKLQALGLHPNRSPICKLISSEDLFALMDALEEPVPEEVHQHLETVSVHSTPLSPSSPQTTGGTVSSQLLPSSLPTTSFSGVPLVSSFIGEDKENGFESTLHEVNCSDGQSLSMLRSWNGDHFLCLLEIWRRYFPEVNRSHLSTVIKKLLIETQIPTSQQTNLLRAAGVISMRGAPGRLIRLRDVQRLMDDFGIPLHIGSDNSDPQYKSIERSRTSPQQLTVYHNRTFYPAFTSSTNSPGIVPEDEASQVSELASSMQTLLELIKPTDMETLLGKSQQGFENQIKETEEEIHTLSLELNLLQKTLLGGRDLCQTLTDEISFLTVSNHTHMAEIVRLSRVMSQSLHELDSLVDSSQLLPLLS